MVLTTSFANEVVDKSVLLIYNISFDLALVAGCPIDFFRSGAGPIRDQIVCS